MTNPYPQARMVNEPTTYAGRHRQTDMPRCLASRLVTAARLGAAVLLTCDRPHEHTGPHWDETDNISWKYGCPPGEQESRHGV